MNGRPPMPIYQYDELGNLINTYNSLAELRLIYYIGKHIKTPIFTISAPYNSMKYQILNDNTLVSPIELTPDIITNIYIWENTEYKLLINSNRSVKPFNVLNLENKVIASFIDINIASKLLHIPYTAIHRRLNLVNIDVVSADGLRFKYK